MFFKLFSKSATTRPRIEENSVLADDLARRVSAIEFKPSKGFLKDRPQLKRSPIRSLRSS